MAFGRKREPSDAELDARTRVFSDALHNTLGTCANEEQRYKTLLLLAALLGGYASESQKQHEAAVEAIAIARAQADRMA